LYREPGTAYDQQLIWDVFTNYSSAEGICAVDPAYRRAVDSMLVLLDNGIHIGTGGDILEWPSGAAGETNHRHLSHLICLHPGFQVSPYINTTNANAARQALINRGDGTTGWSCAWRAQCWARLNDGARAYHQLGLQIRNYVYGNLLDNCNNVFQIDGNCGGPSAVVEMLLQSHLGEIVFLPALPSSWPRGNVKGLCARGAFDVDMYWNGSQFDSAWVLSKKGTRCRIRGTGYYVYDQNRVSVACSTTTTQINFATISGMRYLITRLPVGVRQPGQYPVLSGRTREFEFAGFSQKIVLPACPVGREMTVAVYDIRGKLLGRHIVKKQVVDLRKEFGLSRSVVIVKTEIR
jgi:alpha-L-fucosidase 2